MPKTLFIVNPHAGKSKAGEVWESLEPLLRELFGDMLAVVTQSPADLLTVIETAVGQGVRQVISIGGDGTNFTVLNALIQYNDAHPDNPLVYGTIPAGTGRDFARGAGIPLDVEAAARQVAGAQPRLIDVGTVRYDGTCHHFLNVSSAGLSYDVVQRVERTRHRRPWTFLKAVVTSVLQYQGDQLTITLDEGDVWFDGRAFVVAVANGTTFGQGMQIAPTAQLDDGLFDVVVVEAMPRLALYRALPSVFSGKHLSHPKVHLARAEHVSVHDHGRLIGMDFDGEGGQGREITYAIRPRILKMLI